MPGMRQVVDFVTSGKLGPVKLAHALCYKRRPSIGLVDTPAPLPPGLDFDLWAGPAPAEIPIRKKLHYDWHWDHRTGNGDLGNQNPHELDKARWGLGKQTLPTRVVSLGGRLGVANIWWGSEGYVVAPSYTAGVAFDYDGHVLGKWSGGSDQNHYDNFIKAVKSRRREDLHLDIEDGHLSSALAHLGNVSWTLGRPVEPGTRPSLAADDPRVKKTLESFEAHLAENAVDFTQTKLALGRTLTIDPAIEKSDDPEANRLFTRDYRKGYELPRA